jgi:signal transduction histidine kinase
MILAIIVLTAFINILLGIISYNKNPKSATHRLLTILSFIFAFWSIANYFSLNSSTPAGTLFWIRAVMFITAPMGPVLFLFIKAFPNSKLVINKVILNIIIILTALVMVLAFSPLIFSKVTIAEQITPTPGPAIPLFAVLFVGLPIAGIFELFKKYKKTTGVERLQLRYLILGIVVTFILLILTNFIAVIVFNYSKFVIFGPMFTLIFVSLLSYSIVKHRLLAIRLLIARSVVYTLLLGIIIGIYTLSIFVISHYIIHSQNELFELFTYAALAAFIALSLQPIKNFVEDLSSRLLYVSRYNSAGLILKLTTIIAASYKLKDITQKTLKELLNTLHINHGIFIIFKKNGTYVTIHQGFSEIPVIPKNIINSKHTFKRITLIDEETNSKIKDLMKQLDVAVILPLIEQGKIQGLLLLGDKKSGQMYTQQDITLLEIFGSSVSVAIQNANAYEEIRHFNTTLKANVENATKELQNAHERLKILDKQKDEFIGMASHELKTPITSIKAYSQVLYKQFQSSKDNSTLSMLENVNAQADKLTYLINDLLNISHIEAGKFELKFNKFNFNKLLKRTIENIQYTTNTHKIIAEGTIASDITADESKIEQVLSNLLTNAIKYSPKANKVKVSVTKQNKHLLVSVQDFGEGISNSNLEKIFDRYYRVKNKQGGNISGFGLGLYISAEIIRRHKGTLNVESALGKGSTFYFILPLK